MTTKTSTADGLALLRQEFPAHQISRLPRITCPDCSKRTCTQHKKNKCNKCGSYITTAHIDLDYVGHAALTDRLLEADPQWQWEPVSFDDKGLPAFDHMGGLWIRLTVCGVTRLGYGDAQGKNGNNAVKEAIGDGLRNAAMRFGAALDLWHKGELHADEATAALAEHNQLTNRVLDDDKKAERGQPADDPWAKPVETDKAWFDQWVAMISNAGSKEEMQQLWAEMVQKHKDLGLTDADRVELTELFKTNAAALPADQATEDWPEAAQVPA